LSYQAQTLSLSVSQKERKILQSPRPKLLHPSYGFWKLLLNLPANCSRAQKKMVILAVVFYCSRKRLNFRNPAKAKIMLSKVMAVPKGTSGITLKAKTPMAWSFQASPVSKTSFWFTSTQMSYSPIVRGGDHVNVTGSAPVASVMPMASATAFPGRASAPSGMM